jgi:predicted metalloendopeptidase
LPVLARRTVTCNAAARHRVASSLCPMERYLVFFEQTAISLPDESYYREERIGAINHEDFQEVLNLPDGESMN